MEPQTIAPESRRFYAHLPEFHGVLAQAGPHRLALSSKGTWYMHQRQKDTDEGEQWQIVRKAKLLSRIADKLPASLLAEMPESLADDPRECPRPWQEDLKEARQITARANACARNFAGVIATSQRGRIVRFWNKAGALIYGLQVLRPEPWGLSEYETVCQSPYADVIRAALCGERGKRCAPLLSDALLWLEAGKLPADVALMKGPKPPRIAEVAATFRKPKNAPERSTARQRTEASGTRGEKRPHSGGEVRQGGKAAKEA